MPASHDIAAVVGSVIPPQTTVNKRVVESGSGGGVLADSF
jgi:phospholipid N-methyltransferase